jgi:hypothetical protein
MTGEDDKEKLWAIHAKIGFLTDHTVEWNEFEGKNRFIL